MLLDGDTNPQALMIWGIFIAFTLLIMIFGVSRTIKVTQERRANLIFRVENLPLGNMVKRIHLPLKRYFQLTTDLDVDRQIQKCENCAKTEICKRVLVSKDEDIDLHSFCPNQTELEALKKKSRIGQVNFN